jgi:DNA polymerase III delta prime subunit
MIDSIAQDLLWSQKYRPQRISETILPEKTKTKFQKFVDDENIPNLLLSGSPGTGKTTAAVAMLKELECDYIMINGSLNGGIDTLRHEITGFASSVSFTGKKKYVIIDESDYLTPNLQAGLRSFLEEFSKNCGFILTCNFKNRIIEPLHSRFSLVEFAIEKEEKPKLAAKFFKRILSILDAEKVSYDPKVIAKIIEKYFPDFRRILNELQSFAASGKIDESIFVNIKQDSIIALFDLLKEKNFTEMRKWVAANSDQDFVDLFRKIYEVGLEKIEMKTMPAFVVTLADYQYKHAFVADHEVNFIAFLVSIMIECEFK